MDKASNLSQLRKLCVCVCAATLGVGITADAQSVIFPQPQQPGAATLSQSASQVYLLANDLIAATYAVNDGVLSFEGASALGLKPSSDLFLIKLASGDVISSSTMTLQSVEQVDLTADADAAKGALRFDGKALQAVFTDGVFTVTWRAVLRDGSHYLRTELEISASADVAMSQITPMLYNYDSTFSSELPAVVGNTRGAVLANDKIFAGLETPMGIVSLGYAGAAATESNFTYNSWTPESWNLQFGDATPQEILDLGFTADQIVATQGSLTFEQAGATTVTFTYSSGTHRMNLVGVDVVDTATGKVISADYHTGYTGNAKSDNEYTINIPVAGAYRVRFFAETKTETITSSGNITYSTGVSSPLQIAAGTDTSSSVASSAWSVFDKTAANYPTIINSFKWSDVVKAITQSVVIAEAGELEVSFAATSGEFAFCPYGVDLVDADGNVVASEYHFGTTSSSSATDCTYTLTVPQAGAYTMRYFAHGGNLDATVTISVKYNAAEGERTLQGVWSRGTTLAAGDIWSVSSVVGLIAPGQSRRSFLAYSERERAVAWRPFTIYNSWYELNIDRNNDADYHSHMTTNSCLDVMNQWHTNLFDKYNTSIKAFVWDDGWDSYGTWTFNPNFPNGFTELDELGRTMNTGMGAWLGPVGGYGTSGSLRRSYWTDKGGMYLSNPDYYNVFLTACSNMINDYDFRFFKFDGISTQWSSVGPDSGTTGEENAEGIISLEREVRKLKPDIFLNTTVGTWASPFWFQITDAVWRQENDWSTIGDQGTDREKWITYRDRLVYQNFVQNSPLCPINTLMTHGVILTNYGSVSKDMTYAGVVRELRCAYACGSGMVELYTDYSLLNSINNGALWGDIAECIAWQEKNADVLPDIHWVGGNPWDGSNANIYGWASWNGEKATLALRNPKASSQEYSFTLREALEIPDYVTGTISWEKAFNDQITLYGFSTAEPIDIDTTITVKMPGSSVYVFDGKENNGASSAIETVEALTENATANTGCYDMLGRKVSNPRSGCYIINGVKTILK